ncbi:MAG: TrkA family potassium uptake protein [Acidimicrobiia bacterium]|nr:TrkA family potassium uptake protein [Acidimicrobiia bacterium]
MHVVVVGCGRVGSELAVTLAEDGHTVGVIDKNATAFRRLHDDFTGVAVVGYGFDRDTLLSAGIDRASALAAVTNGDNSNIVTARVARESFGIEHVVARIYDPRRATVFQRLGIPTVATVSWTTDQVLRRLLPEDSHVDWLDASGGVGLVELAVPKALAGRRFADLEEPGQWATSLVTRLGTAQLAAPGLVAQEGDRVHLTVRLDAIGRLRERFGTAASPSAAGAGR